MRVFAISDLHTDYAENARWVAGLSLADHRDDALVVAGDVSDVPTLLASTLDQLVRRFRRVVFVPGNHELWVIRQPGTPDSLRKFAEVLRIAKDCGVTTSPWSAGDLTIVPLQGWYDGSFGEADSDLRACWADYHACRWPAGMGSEDVASQFLRANEPLLYHRPGKVISCSHFLPRIDVMPVTDPGRGRWLHPVLGSHRLEEQVRRLGSTLHVYGHSHVNRHVRLDGVTYVNNALGYPSEAGIASRSLACIHGEGAA